MNVNSDRTSTHNDLAHHSHGQSGVMGRVIQKIQEPGGATPGALANPLSSGLSALKEQVSRTKAAMENPKNQPHLVFALLMAVLLLMPVLGLLADTVEHDNRLSDIEKTPLENAGIVAQFENSWKTGLIQGAYLFNAKLSKLNINTQINGNRALLSGAVETQAQRDLAEKVALSIQGIEAVNNQLHVQKDTSDSLPQTAPNRHTDAAVTTRVKSQLLANRRTSALAIDVLTRDRTVTLIGEVENDAEKELALLIARNTGGVQQVINKLQVRSSVSQAGLSG